MQNISKTVDWPESKTKYPTTLTCHCQAQRNALAPFCNLENNLNRFSIYRSQHTSQQQQQPPHIPFLRPTDHLMPLLFLFFYFILLLSSNFAHEQRQSLCTADRCDVFSLGLQSHTHTCKSTHIFRCSLRKWHNSLYTYDKISNWNGCT